MAMDGADTSLGLAERFYQEEWKEVVLAQAAAAAATTWWPVAWGAAHATAVLHRALVQGYDNPADEQHQAAWSWFRREIRSAMESSLAG